MLLPRQPSRTVKRHRVGRQVYTKRHYIPTYPTLGVEQVVYTKRGTQLYELEQVCEGDVGRLCKPAFT